MWRANKTNNKQGCMSTRSSGMAYSARTASNDKQMYMRTRSDDGTPGAQSVVAVCGALVPLQSASVASASTSQAAVNQCTPPIAAPIGPVMVAVFTTMMCTVLWCDWSASVSAKNV